MKKTPVSFFIPWAGFDDNGRANIMCELAANGIRHIVLTDALLKQMSGNYSMLATIQKQADEAGLRFTDSHAPFREYGDLFIPDTADQRQMIMRHQLCLNLAAGLGVKTCTFHIGGLTYEGFSLCQYRDALYRALDELLPVAEKLDIVICLENVNRPLSTAAELTEHVKRYNSPALAICFDSGHANIAEKGRTLPDSLVPKKWACFGAEVQWEQNIAEKLQPEMVTCHIHDNFGIKDDHRLPGDGNTDWTRIQTIIRQAPRLKCIQCEVVPFRNQLNIGKIVNKMHKLFGDFAEI